MSSQRLQGYGVSVSISFEYFEHKLYIPIQIVSVE